MARPKSAVVHVASVQVTCPFCYKAQEVVALADYVADVTRECHDCTAVYRRPLLGPHTVNIPLTRSGYERSGG
jgi:uncharacterized Zn finger protein